MSDERAGRYSDLFGVKHEHASSSDCALCPICATIGALRRANPEIVEHLTAAARELVVAAGMLLEEAGEAMGADPRTKSAEEDTADKVRRIDIV